MIIFRYSWYSYDFRTGRALLLHPLLLFVRLRCCYQVTEWGGLCCGISYWSTFLYDRSDFIFGFQYLYWFYVHPSLTSSNGEGWYSIAALVNINSPSPWSVRFYFWFTLFLLFQVQVHPSSSNRESSCFCCSISYIHIDDATATIIQLLIQFWSLCCHCPCFPPSQIFTQFDQASCSKCHFHHIHLVDTVAFASFFKDPYN